MAIEPEVPFPLLVNLGIYLCVRIKAESGEDPQFAFIPLGRALPRFITLPSDKGYTYVLLEDVLRSMVDRFFPGNDDRGMHRLPHDSQFRYQR